ncbi:hypothetical protein Pelo_7292 [Pelomyxa schiedti]|nr:hypothetical protein Pelo_7292 [Pelomyxa schiedti]
MHNCKSRSKKFANFFQLEKLTWYGTQKVVKIKDTRAAIIYWLLVAGAIFAVLFWFIYWESGWAVWDTMEGTSKTFVSLPDNQYLTLQSVQDSCNSICAGKSACLCEFQDSADLVYPEEQETAMFVATRVNITMNQILNPSPCSGFSSVCSQQWIGGTQKSIEFPLIDKFKFSAYTEAIAPHFFILDGEKWQVQSEDLWGQVIGPTGHVVQDIPRGEIDFIDMDVLLSAAGVDHAKQREDGGLLRVEITFGDCKSLLVDKSSRKQCKSWRRHNNKQINYYQYRVTLMENPPYHVKREVYNPGDMTTRTLWDATGYSFRVVIQGTPLRFNPWALYGSLIIFYIFFSISTILVDGIVFFLLPGRRLYRSAKYSSTRNLRDLRAEIAKERNFKQKSNSLRTLVKTQGIETVTETLDQTAQETHWTQVEQDQLVLVCVEVYSEYRDLSAATALSQRLVTPEAKLKGLLLSDLFQDAYDLAVTLPDPARWVQMVKQNSTSTAVLHKCEAFLRTGRKRAPTLLPTPSSMSLVDKPLSTTTPVLPESTPPPFTDTTTPAPTTSTTTTTSTSAPANTTPTTPDPSLLFSVMEPTPKETETPASKS